MIAKRPRIMVVDDDSGIRTTLEAIIEDAGYEVIGVDNGYEAIELARTAPSDLIFLDINMPGINGVETFRGIKEANPEIVVVMMTAHAMAGLVEEALAEGAYAVVYKPLDVGQLIDTIQSVLKTHLVLVVDDSSSDRETLRAILKSSGYKVSTAVDGYYAIAMATERHYDIVLMDLRMPGMDGFYAFQEIRKIDPLAKFIFITAYTVEEPVEEGVRSGAYTVLTKPVDPDAMLALMDSITS